jgi:hypothetical protein
MDPLVKVKRMHWRKRQDERGTGQGDIHSDEDIEGVHVRLAPQFDRQSVSFSAFSFVWVPRRT